MKPEPCECPTCHSMFTPMRNRATAKARYCSPKCQRQHGSTAIDMLCACCGKPMKVAPSHLAGRSERCCSIKCRREYYRGTVSKNWNGGTYVAGTGVRFAALPRPDRVGRFQAEHRAVAIRQLGRLISSSEIVFHLDRDSLNNSSANLYVCASRGEFFRIRAGTDPWPTQSNLPP